ncbi:MAG: hypothetical protein EA377_07695 [Phycisphaerales bacterium]|nr:MAG: hypothetical protein EA377_07695 [Phycisphaerales bacterium]
MSKSQRHVLGRVRSAYDPVTWDVCVGDAIIKQELPFTIGVLSDVCGTRRSGAQPFQDRGWIDVDPDNFDIAVQAVQPELLISVPNEFANDGSSLQVHLSFCSCDDFQPERLAEQLGYLHSSPNSIGKAPLPGAATPASIRNESDRSATHRTDVDIWRQVESIKKHEDFCRLESCWRGLQYLMKSITNRFAGLPRPRCLILPCSKEELSNDVLQSLRVEDTSFYKRAQNDGEWRQQGTGGRRWKGNGACSMIVVDFEFGGACDDIAMLEKISEVGKSLYCPVLAGASAKLLNQQWDLFASLQHFTEGHSGCMSDRASPRIQQWKSFRQRESSRFCVVTLPRVSNRISGRCKSQSEQRLCTSEELNEERGLNSRRKPLGQYSWMNGAYVIASAVATAYCKTGWCTHFVEEARGCETGGLLGVEASGYAASGPMQPPAATMNAEQLGDKLRSMGLSPLFELDVGNSALCQPPCSARNVGNVVHKTGTTSPSDDHIKITLPYIMAISRCAQYIRAICQDKLWEGMNTEDTEEYLNNWVANHVFCDEQAINKDQYMRKSGWILTYAHIQIHKTSARARKCRVVATLKPLLGITELAEPVQIEIDVDVASR